MRLGGSYDVSFRIAYRCYVSPLCIIVMYCCYVLMLCFVVIYSCYILSLCIGVMYRRYVSPYIYTIYLYYIFVLYFYTIGSSSYSNFPTDTSYATRRSSSSSPMRFIYSLLWIRPHTSVLLPTSNPDANLAFLPQQIHGM